MGYAQHRCVMHAQAEQAALWYYRDTADGLEYLCADGRAASGARSACLVRPARQRHVARRHVGFVGR